MASTYKEAGVDVEAGDALVDWLIAGDSKNTSRKQPHADKLVSGIGGVASLFRAQFGSMKSPCLVSSTDGVGTKVKIAAEMGQYKGVGQDLVAMCVNDLACVGAEPLFFLDYYACGKLRLPEAKEFLTGVREACMLSGCVLIGGETAEMPGVYAKKDFDCAGFVVGVVDEEKALGSHKVKAGDRLLGVASSGFHSNGYSLLRKVFARDLKKWADILLKPTHLYAHLVNQLLRGDSGEIHAAAHITGGGMDNLMRVIPKGLSAQLKPWKIPSPFLEVRRRAKMDGPDLLRTLNCGVGLILVVEKSAYKGLFEKVRAAGYEPMDLGQIEKNSKHDWFLDFKAMGLD